MEENFKKQFYTLLTDRLDLTENNIKPGTKFVDLGANSLHVVELMVDCEKVFSITIPDEDIEKIVTIGDAEMYLKTRLNINI
jgi:acyl carrier protein